MAATFLAQLRTGVQQPALYSWWRYALTSYFDFALQMGTLLLPLLSLLPPIRIQGFPLLSFGLHPLALYILLMGLFARLSTAFRNR